MREILLAFVLSLATLPLAQAQDAQPQKASTENTYYGGFGQFNIGVMHNDFGALNSRLEANGYEGLDETGMTTGGSGYGIIKRVIIGGGGFTSSTEKGSGNGFRTEAITDVSMFQVGYVAYGKGHWLIYPLLGVGKSTTEIKFLPENGTSFDAVLQQPGRSSTLTYTNTILHASISANYFLNSGNNFTGGLLLGLKAGVNFRPGTGEWNANDVAVSDAPNMNRSQFFVEASIGGGGIIK